MKTATDTDTDTTAKPLSMASIRSSLPEYFGRDAVNEAQALIDRLRKFAPLCATLAGLCVERAQSGNSNGLSRFDTWAQGLKHAQGARMRALSVFVLGVKPQSLKSALMADYEDFAQLCEVQLLSLATPRDAQPRAKPENWKQRAVDAEAALAACIEKCAKLEEALAVAVALAKATATATV